MDTAKRDRIIIKVIALLEEFIDTQESDDNIVSEESDTKASTTEMLTVKECTDLIQGLTAYTVRLLASSGKISSVRAGEGKNGKILVNKSSLLDYMNRNNVR